MKPFSFLQTSNTRAFLFGVLSIVVISHMVAYAIWDIPYDRDDFLFETQLQKLEDTDTHLQTIVVGDSAAGLAIDATTLSALAGHEVLNLALTRSNGFISSLMMAKQARVRHPEIQNIIIVQSYDVWNMPFSRETFFKSEKGIDTPEIGSHFFVSYKWLDRVAYRADLKWLYRYVKFVVKGPPAVAFENDYIKINLAKTYHNGGLQMEEKGLPVGELEQSERDGYLLLDAYCKDERLNCVFIGAPLHETTFRNTDPEIFERIYAFTGTAEAIRSIDTIFSIPNEHMLDSITHLHPTYKEEMTQRYYEELKGMLRED